MREVDEKQEISLLWPNTGLQRLLSFPANSKLVCY